MDPHPLVTDAFWQSESSWLMESGQARDISAMPFPSVVFATSGSTGKPRFIALSKTSLLLSAETVNDHCHAGVDAVWGLCLPWWHVGGFGVLARAYQRGCAFTMFSRRWNAVDAWTWLSDARVTHLSLVPTQVHDFVAAGIASPPSLRVVIVGGGRLEQGLGERARSLGWPVLASYGMTEAGSQIATQHLASLSQPYVVEPLPLLSCWQGRTAENGIIEIAGPVLFHGECHREGDGWMYQERVGEWYRSQDCGEVADGRLFITHRADSLVKVLGELVNPSAIEATLVSLGFATGGFAVLALSDSRQQHRLVLVHEGMDACTVAAIMDRYHSVCAGYERISEVIAVPEFPRSDLGKIQRRALRDIVLARSR